MERNLLQMLRDKRRSATGVKRYAAMFDYYQRVHNATFFTQTITERVALLYDLIREIPHLSARCGHEIIGEDFNGNHSEIPTSVFRETWYECDDSDLNISAYLEARARLAVLKGAVDYVLYKSADQPEKADRIEAILGYEVSGLDLLPKSFRDALRSIEQEPYFAQYPVFWQWFLWFFGGFILTDRQNEEYEIMAEKTGVPADNIEKALAAFDCLFPRDGGRKWLQYFDDDKHHYAVLPLVSVPFRGVGAFQRLQCYGQSSYSALGLHGAYTGREMSKWHKVGYDVLNYSE